MTNCFDLISKAVDLYANRSEYCYLYGAKGQVVTDDLFKSLIICEPEYFSQYSKEQMDEIYWYSIGKIGIDCSGYIKLITGVEMPSFAWIEKALNKTTPKAGTWGNMLFTTFNGTGRHIGIDIGEGRFLHIPKEMHTIEFGMISEYAWEQSGQFPDVSYFLAGSR